MSEHQCDICDRKFDSERGLKIHSAQMHSEEKNDEDQQGDMPKRENNDSSLTLTIGIRQAVTISFIFGLVTGLLLGTMMFAVSGIGLDAPAVPEDETEEPVESENGETAQEDDWENIISLDDRPYLGDSDAEVTIVSFEDFMCPFCTGYNNEDFAAENNMNSAFNDIKQNYIEEGKAKYYFNYFPGSVGYEAHVAHESVLEHGSEDAYWEFKDMHFENFDSLSQEYQTNPEGYRETIKSEVESLDTDQEEFERTFNSNIEEVEHLLPVEGQFTQSFLQEEVDEEINNRLQSQTEQAQQIGVSATPTIMIDGEIVEGAQAYSAFETVIEEKLN